MLIGYHILSKYEIFKFITLVSVILNLNYRSLERLIVPSMSFYPDFIQILSIFYLDFIQNFYPFFIQIFSRFYPDFLEIHFINIYPDLKKIQINQDSIWIQCFFQLYSNLIKTSSQLYPDFETHLDKMKSADPNALFDN